MTSTIPLPCPPNVNYWDRPLLHRKYGRDSLKYMTTCDL